MYMANQFFPLLDLIIFSLGLIVLIFMIWFPLILCLTAWSYIVSLICLSGNFFVYVPFIASYDIWSDWLNIYFLSWLDFIMICLTTICLSGNFILCVSLIIASYDIWSDWWNIYFPAWLVLIMICLITAVFLEFRVSFLSCIIWIISECNCHY